MDDSTLTILGIYILGALLANVLLLMMLIANKEEQQKKHYIQK